MLNEILEKEQKKDYFLKMNNFLKEERKTKQIFPKEEDVFRAFNLVNNNLKVIILGQDPYYVRGMADGLAFSSNLSNTPKSLANIKKELKNDLNIDITTNNSLINWSKQGVLLLNTVLTVEEGKPLSHHGIGWEEFSKNIFIEICKINKPLVFILWGNEAISYKKYIKNEKHLVISSSHPSPLSAYRTFFGSKPFSKANNHLIKNNIPAINFEI